MQPALRSLLLASSLLAAGCATPVMPSGGPPDRTPPTLVGSDPAGGAVHVATDRLALTFSKPVDEQSLRRAITVTPDFEQPLNVLVRGRQAEIHFPQALREQTTYVVTIGTEMQDLRNNRLPAPITVAFATGAQLDEGAIGGWVRNPRSGAGVPNVAVLAYVLPDDDAPPPDPRAVRADYRTETDTRGRFQFAYLREAPYFVVAVEDLNRNRRADPGEAFAVPPEPSVRALPAGDTTAAPVLPLYITRIDTLAPEPVRVRPRSESRFAVRFTEPVLLANRDPDAFAVVDSASGAPVNVRQVYADEDPLQIVVHTDPMQPTAHRFDVSRPSAVTDTAGNVLRPRPLVFTPSTAPDTAVARVAAFEPVGLDTLRTLRPGQEAVVRFTSPPLAPPADERIDVLTPAGAPVSATVTTTDGLRYRVAVDEAGAFDVHVRQPDTTLIMRFRPAPADSLGDLTGTVAGAPEGSAVIVEATAGGRDAVRARAAPDGSFSLRNLPAGVVRLRIFADEDGSETWNGGRLAPYHSPELLRIIPDVRVRARWETELEEIELDPSEAPPPTAPAPATPRDPRDVEPTDERLPGTGGERQP